MFSMMYLNNNLPSSNGASVQQHAQPCKKNPPKNLAERTFCKTASYNVIVYVLFRRECNFYSRKNNEKSRFSVVFVPKCKSVVKSHLLHRNISGRTRYRRPPLVLQCITIRGYRLRLITIVCVLSNLLASHQTGGRIRKELFAVLLKCLRRAHPLRPLPCAVVY